MDNRFPLFAVALILLLVISHPVVGQEITFNHISPSEENPVGIISGITQDAQGYMWFTSSRGLHQYDGYQTILYRHDPLNSNSLAATNAECVYSDSHGIIWVGTSGGGLDKLDPATGVFTHFRYNLKDQASLASDWVNAILQDHEGIIWIGTRQGLNSMDPETGKFIRYQHVDNDPNALSNDDVRAIYEDREGILWLGTGSPFIGDHGVFDHAGGLNRLDRKTGKFTRYAHDPKDPHSLIDNRVRAIFEDSRGTFWVGTAGDGLHTMNRNKGSFERHLCDPANPGKLSRPPLKNTLPYVDDNITFISEDATGAIWIGTMENGLNRYDPKTEKITHYGSGTDSLGGFTDFSGWQAYNSREGVLWIGTWEGNLFSIDPLHKKFPYYYLGAFAHSFYEEINHTLWIGTGNGLVYSDADRRIQKRYINDSLDPASLSYNNINMIRKDEAGKFWIATDLGLNRFDPRTEKFTRYLNNRDNNNSLISNGIMAIYEDREHNLWIGTAGLDKMDTRTGKFIHFQNDPADTSSLSRNNVRSILEDRRNQLWVGTLDDGGLNQLNRQTGKFKRYLNGSNVSGIFEDADGTLWVATFDALYRFNHASGSFSPFVDPNSGTRISGVLELIEDSKKNLWLYTRKAIIRLNSKRDSIKIYGKEFGVNTTNFDYGEAFIGPRGNIIFGDQTGYYNFFPDEFTGNSIPPQITFSNFHLGEQLVKPGLGSALNVPLSQTKEIRLNYNQNVFTFDFAVLHYSSPENNRHLYMLENYDNLWRQGVTEQRAFYFNVPPGRYIFRVKAANYVGVWAEKSIKIIITPPWWQTWWFRIVSITCLVLLIYAIVKVRVLSVRKAEQQKSKIQKEILELEAKALRAQMNPHFIFNCLNSIKSLIQENENEKSVTYLTTFSKLIRTLFNNADKKEISLHDEIETCKLYLQLEAMRFDAGFTYKMQIDESLDLKSVTVPALVVQPFIENAVWHGIIPRGSGGHIELVVQQTNGSVEIIIDDNGIGRESSRQNKPASSFAHQSKGVNLTQSRLELDNLLKQRQAKIEIIDKKDEDGTPGGTKVIIQFNEQLS